MNETLVIAGREFKSRLIVGTGKYSSFAVMQRAHEASGADMVTVAVRRVNISDRSKESLLDYIDTRRIALLPNTAGCYTADDAVRTARLGREAGLSNWVKLEVAERAGAAGGDAAGHVRGRDARPPQLRLGRAALPALREPRRISGRRQGMIAGLGPRASGLGFAAA